MKASILPQEPASRLPHQLAAKVQPGREPGHSWGIWRRRRGRQCQTGLVNIATRYSSSALYRASVHVEILAAR
jgi:hypothetical protein